MVFIALKYEIDTKMVVFSTVILGVFTQAFAGLAALIATLPVIGPLIVKIFKDGQKTYGSRAWSSMIVKRMEDLNKIDFRAKGFPNELIDNEPEEKGYEI